MSQKLGEYSPSGHLASSSRAGASSDLSRVKCQAAEYHLRSGCLPAPVSLDYPLLYPLWTLMLIFEVSMKLFSQPVKQLSGKESKTAIYQY